MLTTKSLLLLGPGPCLVVILVLCLPGASFGCVFASDWLAYLLLIGWPTCFWLIGLLVPLCALLAHGALTLACHECQTHPLVLPFFFFLDFLDWTMNCPWFTWFSVFFSSGTNLCYDYLLVYLVLLFVLILNLIVHLLLLGLYCLIVHLLPFGL